jgi:hypothetical protein
MLAGAASALLFVAVLALLATHAGAPRGSGDASAEPCPGGRCASLPRCVRPRERSAVGARVVPCAPLAPRQRPRSRSHYVIETRPTIVP